MALLALAPAAWVSVPERAQATAPSDAVLDWNRYAMEALVNRKAAATPGAEQPPPVAVQHLAMVQGAVYDAVNAIDGGHQPYLTGLPPADPSASKAAAVATAAHDVLHGALLAVPTPAITPPENLRATILARLADLRDQSILAARTQDGDPAVDAGIAAGETAAEQMLARRANDGRYGSFRFVPGSGIGAWQPTGSGNDPNAWVARLVPFTLESRSQFRTKGPRALTSGAYAQEYQEVKDFGGQDPNTTRRTPEQTQIAHFFTVNPVELFNRMLRAMPRAQALPVADQARLLAMFNMAGADALINCWDDKNHWNFWRPVTAINQGDRDNNPKTAGDASWTSLIANPPYADHPSGFNCVTAALMYTAEGFFGAGGTTFSVTSFPTAYPNGVTRQYEHFRDVVQDAIDARVWLGLHFRSADEQGAGIGRNVAQWVAAHYFQPVKR